MRIYYCTGQQRKFSIDVNGKYVKTFTVNNGSWDTSSSVECEIELEPGENNVRLYNPDSWAPDIDRMTLELIEAPTAIREIESSNLKSQISNLKSQSVYDLNGRPVANPDAMPKGTVYIRDKQKVVK